MSENFFEENNKFWSFNGVIGRRGYILNYLYIQIIISLVFITPLTVIFLLRPEIILNGLYSNAGSLVFPFNFTLYALVSCLTECVLIFPSVVRRVRDIVADDDDSRVTIISSILILIVFLAGAPIISAVSNFKWISVFVLIVLMFMNGKITGEKPKSEVIKFNWGAFWGTWMWGIFNRAWKTLFMLPIFFTPASLPFMIICGMKGNQWAYKKSTKPLDDFHNSQQVQAYVFFFLAPIVSLFIFIMMSIGLGVGIVNYSNAHPEVKTKLELMADRYMEVEIKTYFTKFELAEDEYKFYMDPVIWNELSDESRRKAFEAAVSYSKRQEEKALQKQSKENDPVKIDDISVSQKTKIISSFNNEVLASYEFDQKKYDEVMKNVNQKGGFKALLEYKKDVYKFNDHPSVP